VNVGLHDERIGSNFFHRVWLEPMTCAHNQVADLLDRGRFQQTHIVANASPTEVDLFLPITNESTKELLYWFLEISSKGGNYMLNVGPDGKGIVPQGSAIEMRGMGKWLKTNGQAIYGSSAWLINKEGPLGPPVDGTGERGKHGFKMNFTEQDFWFTQKPGKVYAMSLVKAGQQAVIKSLNAKEIKIKSVRLLGSDKTLNWQQTDQALIVDMDGAITPENGYALEIVL
jgi:alpha-L-fucosidase